MSRFEMFANPLEDFGGILSSVLTPSSAVKSIEFLQGREKQLREVREALAMKGRHVFVHGFRGVGKTSLAFTAAYVIQSEDNDPLYVQCSPGASFLDLVYDIIKQAFPSDPTHIRRLVEVNGGAGLDIGSLKLSAGLRESIEQGRIPRPESINDAASLICFVASRHSRKPVVIIDEFDHMAPNEHVKVDLFIKLLAEVDDLPLKIIMCGVGETLTHLFAAHLSSYRYFHAVKLERLGLEASREIITKAATTLDVTIDDTSAWRIARVSDGFPHFVHLVCEKIFWAMYNDAERDWMHQGRVLLRHYRSGTRAAVSAAHEELRKGYEEAVRKYSRDAELILWAVADGHELQRKIQDIYASYRRIFDDNLGLKDLTEEQFRARVYKLSNKQYGHILKGNKRGWYEFDEKMMRGYARLKAEDGGIELFPDHPLLPKRTGAMDTNTRLVEV